MREGDTATSEPANPNRGEDTISVDWLKGYAKSKLVIALVIQTAIIITLVVVDVYQRTRKCDC